VRIEATHQNILIFWREASLHAFKLASISQLERNFSQQEIKGPALFFDPNIASTRKYVRVKKKSQSLN